MPYHITHVDRHTRAERIRQACLATERREDFYDFRGSRLELPEVRIEIGTPVYRMENFRTFTEQRSQIARNALTPDFFSAGQESESVQQKQHAILVELARKGQFPIIDVIQREGQRESLLITAAGVVVNGNRRLAAMRELFSDDASANGSLGSVNCLVLPADATSNEILEVEAALQARPETRLDYDWIGDAQLLAALQRVRGSVEAVARQLGRRPAEVKNRIQSFAEAELYLREWLRRPGEFSVVTEDGEQFFRDLPGHLAGKSSELLTASRVLAWTLFDNREKLDGRLHNYSSVYGRRAEDALERIAEELEIELTEDSSSEGEAFEFAIDDETGNTSYAPIISALGDTEDRAEAIEALVQVSVGIVESERSHRSGRAALTSVTAAHAKLAEVDITRASPETHTAIERQLDSIAQRVTHLLRQIRGSSGDSITE